MSTRYAFLYTDYRPALTSFKDNAFCRCNDYPVQINYSFVVFSKYDEEKFYNYELRAPGASIMSTYPGGRYKELSGTSMACPYVVGGISRLLQVKEYDNWEILFGDLIHARKKHSNQLVDFEAVYKITDADRKPTLDLVTYALKDTIEGDADGKADAGETLAFYPMLRNEWGLAKNTKMTLELGENEDPTIREI